MPMLLHAWAVKMRRFASRQLADHGARFSFRSQRPS